MWDALAKPVYTKGLHMGVRSTAYVALLGLLCAPLATACPGDTPEGPIRVQTATTDDLWAMVCQGAPYQPNTYVGPDLAAQINDICAQRQHTTDATHGGERS